MKNIKTKFSGRECSEGRGQLVQRFLLSWFWKWQCHLSSCTGQLKNLDFLACLVTKSLTCSPFVKVFYVYSTLSVKPKQAKLWIQGRLKLLLLQLNWSGFGYWKYHQCNMCAYFGPQFLQRTTCSQALNHLLPSSCVVSIIQIFALPQRIKDI